LIGRTTRGDHAGARTTRPRLAPQTARVRTLGIGRGTCFFAGSVRVAIARDRGPRPTLDRKAVAGAVRTTLLAARDAAASP
jgi:hypothetical protein